MKSETFVAAGVATIMLLIAAMIGFSPTDNVTEKIQAPVIRYPRPVREPYAQEVSIADLAQAYRDDPSKIDQTYLWNSLRVRGQVVNTSSRANTWELTLSAPQGNGSNFKIHVEFSSGSVPFSRFSKNQEVTAIGIATTKTVDGLNLHGISVQPYN